MSTVGRCVFRCAQTGPQLERHIALSADAWDRRAAVDKADGWINRQRAIRALYEAFTLDQLAELDTLIFEFDATLTPIERDVQEDLRAAGLSMFQQYPVGPYFLDFADPVKRIGIEADGKAFHDANRDRVRDQRLWDEFGWRVYRVSGAECKRQRVCPEYDPSDDWAGADEHCRADEFYAHTSGGLVDALQFFYYGRGTPGPFFRQLWASLTAHRLASFPIEMN